MLSISTPPGASHSTVRLSPHTQARLGAYSRSSTHAAVSGFEIAFVEVIVVGSPQPAATVKKRKRVAQFILMTCQSRPAAGEVYGFVGMMPDLCILVGDTAVQAPRAAQGGRACRPRRTSPASSTHRARSCRTAH